jgi:YesN/AraC family two-component response regulator
LNYDALSKDIIDPLYSLKMAQYFIKKQIDEILEGPYEINSIDAGDTIITLVNLDSTSFASLEKQIGEIIPALKSVYSIDSNISYSGLISSLCDICDAYNYTKEGIEYCRLKSIDCIQYDEKKSRNTESVYSSYYISKINKKIKNCLEAGNFKDLTYIVDEIFDVYFNGKLTTSRIRLSIYELIHVIFTSINEYNSTQSIKLDSDSIVYELLKCKSISSLKQTLTDIMLRLSANQKNDINNQTTRLIQEINKFVSANYSDYELCVNKIAAEFDMSVPYLSKLFKKETSVKLHDYINSVRISKAKKMLNNYSVSEVAVKVGFNDSSSFIKIFKKFEGITPGQYIKLQIKSI